MQCANPYCRTSAQNQPGGTLRLMEMEVPPDDRVIGADGGFPVCCAQSRYFWLCAQCSRELVLRKWTSSEVIIEPRRAGFTSLQELRGRTAPIVETRSAAR